MRVLVVTSLFAPWAMGGAEVVAESSAQALADLGHDIYVLTLSPNQETSHDHGDGYKIRRVPLVNIYPLQDINRATTLQRVQWHIKDRWNEAMKNTFASELKSIQPDVALLHNIAGFSISIYPELVAASVPFIQVLHDHYFGCLYSTMYRNRSICKNQCLRCSIMRKRHAPITRLASGVVGVSLYILNKIRSLGYFQDTPAHVIRNLSAAPQRCKVSKVYGEKREVTGCIVGFLGGLIEAKGIVDLLRAFQDVARPHDRLVLAGNIDTSVNFFHSLIKNDPRIAYLGVVDRDTFFASIDILVVPSRVPEAFGLVAQEALFRGIPIVASDRGALPEICSYAPSVYVYNPDKPACLSSVLKVLLLDQDRWRRGAEISNFDYMKLKTDWGKSYEAVLQDSVQRI